MLKNLPKRYIWRFKKKYILKHYWINHVFYIDFYKKNSGKYTYDASMFFLPRKDKYLGRYYDTIITIYNSQNRKITYYGFRERRTFWDKIFRALEI